MRRFAFLLYVLAACAHRPDEPAPASVPMRPAPDAALEVPEQEGEPTTPDVSKPPPEALACPRFFEPLVRDASFEIFGERYRIDSVGRPEQALTLIPPVAAEERIPTCQGEVGRWGDLDDPDNDYDGGHLIGSQLGGWGGRANMVPQHANFNRGNWLQLENAAASCEGELEVGQLQYVVTVEYPDDETIIPSAFLLELFDAGSGDSLVLAFENAFQGGPDGTETRRRGVDWLRGLGCE